MPGIKHKLMKWWQNRIDVEVSLDRFLIKSENQTNVEVKAVLYVDNKDKVKSVGEVLQPDPNWIRLVAFDNPVKMAVASAILKRSISPVARKANFWIRPDIHFYGTASIPQNLFRLANNVDELSNKKAFFQILGIVAGAKRVFIES